MSLISQPARWYTHTQCWKMTATSWHPCTNLFMLHNFDRQDDFSFKKSVYFHLKKRLIIFIKMMPDKALL